MNKYDVPAILADKFPEIDAELRFVTIIGDLNKAMSILSKYTRKMIKAGNLLRVQQCMNLSNRIYEEGDAIVKNAVSNIYVYSFSLMSLCCNKVEWNIIKSRIPVGLYTLYMNQVMQSGC